MMGIAELQRLKRAESKLEELEARLAVVERAGSFEKSELFVPRRRPGRPRTKPSIEAPPAA